MAKKCTRKAKGRPWPIRGGGGRSKLDGGGRKAGRRSTLEVKEFFMSAASVMSEGIGIGEGEYLALGFFMCAQGRSGTRFVYVYQWGFTKFIL